MDELCIVVRKAPKIPSELLPLVIFDEILWICLLAAGIFISFIWSFIRYVNNKLNRPMTVDEQEEFYMNQYNFTRWLTRQSQLRHYIQIFIDTWLIFLSVPVRRFTRVQNERIFISSVCLISMIFVSMYQSGMSTVFVKPLYFKDITTLEQLDKSGQQILVKYAGYLDDVFPNDSTPILQNLRQKMKLSTSNKSSMDIVLDVEKTATITRKSTVKLDNSIYFIKNQLFLIERECPKNYFLAFMMPFHSPFMEQVNEILRDIQRYGFIKKWIDDINYENELQNIKKLEVEVARKILSMSDLKFPFLVLISGVLLSTVCFNIEFLVNFLQTRRLKKSPKKVLKVKNDEEDFVVS
jgi:hypothetical protein